MYIHSLWFIHFLWLYNTTTVPDMILNYLMALWGMWSASSLPSLPGLLLPAVVAPDRVLSMGQIGLFGI